MSRSDSEWYGTSPCHQADQNANRERAATETEGVNLRAAGELTRRCPIITTDEFIEINYVPLQPPAECSAKERQRFEGRAANAVIVFGDLLRVGQIQKLKDAPNVRAPNLGGGVCRSRQKGQ